MIDIKRITVFAITVGATIALTGCSIIQDKVDDAVEDGVERAIEEGAGDGTDVEFGENADLPADFPAEVPLPEGDIIGAIGGADGWFVTYTVADTAAVDALFAAFESDGWELVGDFSAGDSQARSYKNDTYDVGIASAPGDDNVTLTISVVPVAE